MTDGAVHCQRRGDAALITFDRPLARNALTWKMYDQLADVIGRVRATDGLRLVVLRGAGGTFIAGTDISQFAEFRSGDDGLAYERRLDELVARLECVPIPTLAVIEGYAVGGGLALAAACDLRVCTPDARFGAPIARTVGNCLSIANTERLVTLLGAARVKAMLLAARFLTAEQAFAAGFVLEVVPAEHLDERVDEIARQLAAHAPLTMQFTKVAIRRLLAGENQGDDLIRRVYASRDFHEGVAAFREKRAPRWEGR